MKKKINIIFEESRYGGPQSHFIQINSNLKKNFLITYFLNKNGSEYFKKKLLNQNSKIKIINFSPLSKKFISFLKYFLFFYLDIKNIKKILLKNDPDMIHVMGGVYSIKSLIASFLTKKKIIWHITDCYSPFYLKIFFLLFYKNCNGIIFASKKSKNYYLKGNSYNHKIIPSPISINKKKKNYNTNDKFLIGSTCNISKIKGIEFLLKIAKKFEKYKDKNILFEIHGRVFKSQKKYLEKLLNLKKENNIKNLTFRKGYTDPIKILKKFDLYLSTSLSESSPTSIWEAMSYGLPIISTKVGDVNLIFKRFNNLIKFDDIDFAHSIIDKYIKSSIKRKKLGNFSYKYAKKNFYFENIAKKQILYYSTII